MDLKELAGKAGAGDGEAFAQLIIQLQTSLYRVARAYLHSEEDIADAVQESILKAWKNIAGLKHPEYFKTWLIRILINEAIRIRNRWEFEIPFDHRVAAGEQEALLPERENTRQEWQPGYGMEFEEMMRSLSEPVRIVMVLYYGEQYSVPEIAEMLNMSKEAVRQRLSRGRKQVRETWLGSNGKEAGR